jgi:hypothetical protein
MNPLNGWYSIRIKIACSLTLRLVVAVVFSTGKSAVAESCHHLQPDGHTLCISLGESYESKDLKGYYHLPVRNSCDKTIAVTAVCGNKAKGTVHVHGGEGTEVVVAPCDGIDGWYESGCEGNSKTTIRSRATQGDTASRPVDNSFCYRFTDEDILGGCLGCTDGHLSQKAEENCLRSFQKLRSDMRPWELPGNQNLPKSFWTHGGDTAGYRSSSGSTHCSGGLVLYYCTDDNNPSNRNVMRCFSPSGTHVGCRRG